MKPGRPAFNQQYFELKRNDTSPAISATIKDNLGRIIDLSGCTARFLMTPNGSSVAKVIGVATVTPGAVSPNVLYQWATGDTDTEGDYIAEFEFTTAGGLIFSSPNDSYLSLRILADLA